MSIWFEPVTLEQVQRHFARGDNLAAHLKIRFTELGPDYLKGPVPAGAMTHAEFLNMVTPKDVQGYAAFDNKQGAIVALTSLAMQYALKTALEAFHDAKDARAKAAARKEVQDALEALRKARLEAGLPVDR